MTGNDELRRQLAGIDPARPGGPGESLPPTPAELKEHIMRAITPPQTPSRREDADPAPRMPRRRRAIAAAAAVMLLAAGAALTQSSRFTDGPTVGSAFTGGSVALQAPSDNIAVSCIRFEPQLLRDMPVAFAGTVTRVAGGTVTLRVTRWYAGTAEQRAADVVTVTQPGAGTSVALDGVDFTDGDRFLVAATNGTVNGCGFSGPATSELLAGYAEAFGQ